MTFISDSLISNRLNAMHIVFCVNNIHDDINVNVFHFIYKRNWHLHKQISSKCLTIHKIHSAVANFTSSECECAVFHVHCLWFLFSRCPFMIQMVTHTQIEVWNYTESADFVSSSIWTNSARVMLIYHLMIAILRFILTLCAL